VTLADLRGAVVGPKRSELAQAEERTASVPRKMRLELRNPGVTRDVGSCYELWQRVNRAEYFQFESYVEEATEIGIPSYAAGASSKDERPEEWANAQLVIDALRRSLDFINQRLPEEPTPAEVKELSEGLEQEIDSTQQGIDSKVLQIVLNHVFVYVSGLGDEIDHLIRVAPGPLAS
jgi:hypothetical protein